MTRSSNAEMNDSSTGDRPDADLANAVANRRQNADDCFEILYRRHCRGIDAFVRARIPREDVDDVIQSVWFKFWSAFPKKFASDNVRSWIFTTARNAIHDYYRRQNNTGQLTESPVDRSRNPLEQLLRSERNSQLRLCLERLKIRDRELIRLVFMGWPTDQIATALEASANAVYKAVKRVKSKLRTCIQNQVNP